MAAVGHGVFLALCGIVIGSVGAVGFVRTLRSMLFNVSPNGPTIFSGVALLLLVPPSPLVTSPLFARHAKILYEHCGVNEPTSVSGALYDRFILCFIGIPVGLYSLFRWPGKAKSRTLIDAQSPGHSLGDQTRIRTCPRRVTSNSEFGFQEIQ